MSLRADGGLEVTSGPPLAGLAGTPRAVDLVVLAPDERDVVVEVDGEPVAVAAG